MGDDNGQVGDMSIRVDLNEVCAAWPSRHVHGRFSRPAQGLRPNGPARRVADKDAGILQCAVPLNHEPIRRGIGVRLECEVLHVWDPMHVVNQIRPALNLTPIAVRHQHRVFSWCVEGRWILVFRDEYC